MPSFLMSAGFTNLITGYIFIASSHILLTSIKCLTRKSPSRCCISDVAAAIWGNVKLPRYIIFPASARYYLLSNFVSSSLHSPFLFPDSSIGCMLLTYYFMDSFTHAFPSKSVASSHPLNVKYHPIVIFPSLYFSLRSFMNVSTSVRLPAMSKSSFNFATIGVNYLVPLIVSSCDIPCVRSRW